MAPHAAAQPAGYPGCSESPETCDPRTVNGGTSTRDEPVTTLLYAHFKHILPRAPLNTQPPDPDHEVDLDEGFLMPTVYSENPVCCRFKNNEFTMFISPGPVEYLADGNWRVHQEPQLDAPVHLVDDVVGYAYFSADSVPHADEAPAPPVGLMPAFGVYMRMETGRHFGEGTLIAEGDTGLGYGSPEAARLQATTTMVNQPGEDVVYEFVVRMPLAHPVIDNQSVSNRGFIVTMRPYQLHMDEQAQFTSADWRIRTGYDYPHRVHITHRPTLYDVGAEVRTDGATVSFDWFTLSSFGSYNVDLPSLDFRLEGPLDADGTGAEVPTQLAGLHVPYNGHGSSRPTNASWQTDPPTSELAEGTYRATASVMNAQGTYRLERNATILLEDGVPRLAADGETLTADEDAPAAGAAVVAAALIGALLLGRPRRRSGKP